MNYLLGYSSRFRILKGGKISLVVSTLLGSSVIANASPIGGTVTSGNASISQTGNVTNINQTTNKASINWTTFNIASNETVNFNQPSASSITLNRVIGNEKSIIDGALNANGQVWLLNSNGVLFGKSASINTSGLLATTAELSDQDFNAGNYDFKNATPASVINEGTIEIVNDGSIILASNEVRNSGTIKAVRGSVHLVGADSYSVNLNGNSLVNLRVNKGVLDALVKNSGHIIADGGEIYLTTNAIDELLKGVVNNTGIIEANGIDDLTGHVELFAHGGKTSISGNVEATGGFIETSGEELDIASGSLIKASHWLIDPTDITIENGGADGVTGSSIDAQTIETYLSGTGSLTLSATNDININENLSNDTASNNTLTLTAANDINVNAVVTVGASDGITLNYGGNLTMARNDATNSFTGKMNLDTTSAVSINGSPYTVINTLGSAGIYSTGTDLQGIHSTTMVTIRNGNYVLGTDIDASSTSGWNSGSGFMPIGNSSYRFGGKFDGLGHKISDLFISRLDYVGLFGSTADSTFQNLGLVNVDIRGSSSVGSLAGLTYGINVKNVFSTGSIEGKTQTSTSSIGGLIGSIESNNAHRDSLIQHSFSKVNVTDYGSGSTAGGIGGLLGRGTGSTTYKISIEDSYASGFVKTAMTGAGGLIGTFSGGSSTNKAIITRSYATGNVVGLSSYLAANGTTVTAVYAGSMGGLVGDLRYTDLSYSYSTGDVSGRYQLGGLVGYLANSTLSDVFSTGNVTSDISWSSTTGRSYNVGGFTGYALYSTINNAYSAGTVDNTATYFDTHSPFIAYSSSSSANNSFWDGTVNTTFTISSLGTSKTTTELYDMDTFLNAGWDIRPDQSLPHDQNQVSTAYPILVTENGITTWKIYGLFIPVSYTLTDILTGSYTYNANSQTPSEWTASSIFGGLYNSWVLGTDYYLYYNGADYTGFTDANTYSGITVNVVKAGYDETSSGSTAGSLVIDQKDITAITGITASDKVYNRSTAATLDTSSVSFTGMIGGDALTVATSTGVFDDWNVGTDKTVSISGLTLGGADAGNYNLTDTTASTTANITAKLLTATNITSVTTTYGTPAATGTGTYSGVETGDSVTVASNVSNPQFSTSGNLKAGTYSQYLSLSGDDAGNYTINYLQPDSYVVNQLAIAGTIASSSSIYGDDPTTNYNSVVFTNVINGDLVTANTQGLATSTAIADVANTNSSGYFDAGNYKVNLGSLNGLDLANYSVHDGTNYYITGDHEITKKTLNVSGLIANNKVYNRDSTASLSGSETLMVGATSNNDGLYYTGDTVGLTGTASASFGNWNVGTAKPVTVSGLILTGDTNNYTLNPTTLSANITAKPLTFTSINGVTTTYGTPAATGTVNFSGVETGDTVTASAILLNPTYSSSGNLKAGTYSQIATLGGANAGNYSIVGLNQNYIVNKLAITGTMANSSTVYGDALNFGNATFANIITGDQVSVNIQGVANSTAITDLATANGAGKIDVGNYTSFVGSLNGLDMGNYSVDDGTNYFITASHQITAKPITIRANNLSKILDHVDPVLTFTVPGLVSGDTISGELLRSIGETVGTYAINQGTLSASANYVVTFVDGVFTITEAPRNDLGNIITPIVNSIAVTIPRPSVFNLANVVTTTPVATSSVNPSAKLVTMNEVKNNETRNTQSANIDFKSPAMPGSDVMLVNGGLKLPDGLDQMVLEQEVR